MLVSESEWPNGQSQVQAGDLARVLRRGRQDLRRAIASVPGSQAGNRHPTDIGFMDDQLFPGSRGISPLAHSHSSVLQQAAISPSQSAMPRPNSACSGLDRLVSGQMRPWIVDSRARTRTRTGLHLREAQGSRQGSRNRTCDRSLASTHGFTCPACIE